MRKCVDEFIGLVGLLSQLSLRVCWVYWAFNYQLL